MTSLFLFITVVVLLLFIIWYFISKLQSQENYKDAEDYLEDDHEEDANEYIEWSDTVEIPDSHVDDLYEITKFMNAFLKKYKIKYWLIGGSLIGALRNTPPGPIKWDDDVDIAIFKRDEDKLLTAMENDKDFLENIEWTEHNFGYQLRIKDRYDFKDYYYDIFIYKKRNGPHGIKWYTKVFPNNYYNNINEILPLKECKFWDLILPCPNDLNTVHRGYEEEGQDVLTYAIKYNHKSGNNDIINVKDCINNGDTLPMLSQKLINKLQFV